ncbi:hypothetical protein ACF0H5_002453 [Mactra antiquata]
MEIGNEISQKIRSAIKAKLIEQGAYVDDELPDYIMVMVANKKSQKQMTDDLSLFLGANTEKFTSWLHSLLKKLQSINTEESTPKPKTKEKTSKGDKRKHRSSQSEKKTDVDKQRKSSTGDREKTEKKKVEDKEEIGTAKVKPLQKAEEVPTDELKIIENTDEFNDENTAAEVKELSQSSSSTGKPPPSKLVKTDKSTDVKKSTTKSSTSSNKTRSNSSSGKSKYEDSHSSKKKPTSIVASVKRRYEELDEEEEEYDPTNPAVGSVASVVRGPTRKSSVPQSLQANKSLLMKAVSEAEKSVTTKKKSPETKPAMRSDRQPIDLKHRLKTAAGIGLISRSKRAEISKKYSSSSTTEETVKKPRKSTEGFENIKYVIKNESTSPTVKKVSPKSSSTASATRVATTALRDIRKEMKVKEKSVEPDSEAEDQEEYGPPLPDTRLVQRSKPVDTDSNPDSSQSNNDQLEEQDSPDPEIQQILDEAHMTLDLNDEEEYDLGESTSKRDSPEPRFIVTLDGVDPDTYNTISDNYNTVTDTRLNPVQSVKPVPKPKPVTDDLIKPSPPVETQNDQTFAKLQPPKIKPFNISLKDTDDEEEGEEMDTEEIETSKSTFNERCRFWPTCSNGNNCQFIHPSVPCRTFPYCKFGDKCIYIHPNCRFDANCTRMDCPYTHSSKRKGLMAPTVIHKILQVPVQQYVPQLDPIKSQHFPVASTQQTQCRFFPNCRNMTCPFTHPKPCRYGIGCMSKASCSFYHPPLPGTDKLKWTSRDNKSNSAATTKPAITTEAGK